MPKSKLTDAAVQKLKAGKGERIDYFDTLLGHGFALRVAGPTPKNPEGTKTWVLFYRLGGTLKRGTLGSYPVLGLGAARDKARDWLLAIKKGTDPAAEEKAERAAAEAAPVKRDTVDDLIKEYLERWAKPRKRSAAEDERMLKRELLGKDVDGNPIAGIDPSTTWRGKPVAEITRRHIVELLDRIVDRGSPIMANRALAGVRRMFNFAIERGLLDASPCVKVKPPAEEAPRERCLSDAEIITVWDALGRSGMEPNIRQILRFMLATGQRKGEVIRLHQRELSPAALKAVAALRKDEPVAEEDQKEATWTLPAERSKNGREHVVPLSPLALEIIAEATPSKDGWIFPSERTGEPLQDRSISHAVRDLYIRRKGAPEDSRLILDGIEPFTPHDLRRTAATGMRSLGVTKDDLKLVLNHKDRSVTGVHYDKYQGLREKRAALETWGRALGSLIRPTPGNVVALRAAQ